MADKLELDEAYNLKSPDDNRSYYGRVADSYDDDFIETSTYVLHAQVAEIFAGHADPDDAPIMDLAAGTGLVGEALSRFGSWPIDAADISKEMLDVARARGIYGALHELDLTAPLPPRLRGYGGVVSAGAFTHGHLGPHVLTNILGLARPGGIFVLSINKHHFEEMGFAAAFDELADFISEPLFVEVPIYLENPDIDHSDDTALIALYRRK